MKFKKYFMIYLVMISIFTSFTWISFSVGDPRISSPDIEWSVTAGTTYTWIVRESNTTYGFLPVNSKYSITIDEIVSHSGGEASEIIVTLTAYNSQTQITHTILSNEMFIYFDSSTNSTSLYDPIYDHGFFMPPDHRYGFIEGLMDYFGSAYDFDSRGVASGPGYIFPHGTDLSARLYYSWHFYENTDNYGITVELNVENYDTGEDVYLLQLERGVPYGNFFLVFASIAIISLVFIYRKKIK